MMMRIEIGIVPRRLAVQREFTDQAGIDQSVKRIIDSGTGSARVTLVKRRPEFFDGGMLGMRQQVLEDEEALRRPAHPCPFESRFDSFRGVGLRHQSNLRNNSKLADVPDARKGHPVNLQSG